MTLDSDILIDRRRLKRRLTIWRVLAILALLGVLFVAASRNDQTAELLGTGNDHIARFTVSGFIGDTRARHELLTKLRKNKNVKAVIVAVDSPGGTTTGGEALYLDLRDLAKDKPVAAVFGTAATSAAYLGGIATDYIVARGNTITGSVGVIFQATEVSDLLSKLGVKVDEIKSGPLKAQPSPFTPITPDGRRVSEELVKDSQQWFAGLVAERRKDAVASLDEINTGRIYTGRQALQIGLIDAIGDEQTAIKWFSEKRNVKEKLRVVDWKPQSAPAFGLFRSVIASAIAKMGFAAFDDRVLSELNALGDRPFEGLFSIWRPSEQN